jgi:macrolide transport system ATP-binding/permease protein
LRVITGEIEPDGGTVAVAQGAVVGYLPQQPPEAAEHTIDDLIYESVGELRALETRLRELERALTDPGADVNFDAVMTEYGETQEQFERRGGYDLDYQIDIVLAGLRISHLPRTRRFDGLSGGEKARVQLATLLLRSPDLLLLDEPTNHLDFGSIAWLEGYLAAYRGTVLVISHDRHFLNRTVTRILELDEHRRTIAEYAGAYDDYLIVRERQRARWAEEYQVQQEEIRELRRAIRVTGHQVAHNRPARDPAKTAYDFKAGRVAVAVSRNVRNAEERLRRIEADPIPRPPDELRIAPDFAPDELRSHEVIVVDRVSKTFGERVVLDDVSFIIGPRDRVVIVGPNGAGKTTLLDIVTSRCRPDRGSVMVAAGARIGYLDQEARLLDPQRTVLETYRDGLVGFEGDLIAELFRYGLFTLDDLGTPVARLSAGQLRKLQIARLVAERANVLLLDEPTNHLGFDVLEEVERALVAFPGPILAVSHDRWFIERFGAAGAKLWELRDGRLLQHAGDPSHTLAHLMAAAQASDTHADGDW